ncbi:hypothetical protein HGRIS_007417 [Hohenbuehelia grisea]|uniref:Uncharacterized protein n=1 Tax=Hohenbuehelia grisea TaxID=104357 RepID=A0ABR3J4R0_9AGAR
MSNSSYPSPASSRGVPARPEQTPPMVRDTGSRNPDPVQTQNNLRDASAALEAAYHRIRSVRRSLLQLQGNFDLPGSQSSRLDAIGPSHDAIVLASSPGGAEEEGHALPVDLGLPPLSLDHLSRYEMDFQRAERTLRWSDPWSQLPALGPTDLPPSPTQSSSPAQIPPQTTSPVSSNPPFNPFRDRAVRRTPLAPNPQFGRRYDSDDPQTTLGRQVAARESGGSSTLPSSLPSRLPTLRRYLETTYVTQLAAAASQPSDPPPFPEWLAEHPSRPRRYGDETRAARLVREGHAFRTMQSSLSADPPPLQQVPTPPLTSLFPPRLSIGSRRWRATREARPSSVQSPASTGSDATRLSMLSNFSIANISSPVSALGRERPLIFEEPMSIDAEEGVAPPIAPPLGRFPRTPTDALPPLDTTTVSARPPSALQAGVPPSYLVQRQIAADGSEIVHQINMDSDDDAWMPPLVPASSLHPYVQRQPTGRRYVDDVYAYLDAVSAPQSGPSRPPRRRRRGWGEFTLNLSIVILYLPQLVICSPP